MSRYVDLSGLDDTQRTDLLHCLERYETFMAWLESQAGYDQYYRSHVPARTRMYRAYLGGNGQFPDDQYRNLVDDLEHLRYIVEQVFEGKGLPLLQRIQMKLKVTGTRELKETIDRTMKTIKV